MDTPEPIDTPSPRELYLALISDRATLEEAKKRARTKHRAEFDAEQEALRKKAREMSEAFQPATYHEPVVAVVAHYAGMELAQVAQALADGYERYQEKRAAFWQEQRSLEAQAEATARQAEAAPPEPPGLMQRAKRALRLVPGPAAAAVPAGATGEAPPP